MKAEVEMRPEQRLNWKRGTGPNIGEPPQTQK